MRIRRQSYPIPLLVKHTQPSGVVMLYPVLVSDVLDEEGTRYARYANGAEVRMSGLRFFQLEHAQTDLESLVSTPLPEQVLRREMAH